MTKTFFASAALLLVAATPAFANEKPTEISFQRDGETYIYSKTQMADRVILSGRYPSGDVFKLTVHGDQVTGFVSGEFISFKMPRAKAGVTPEVAAR